MMRDKKTMKPCLMSWRHSSYNLFPLMLKSREDDGHFRASECRLCNMMITQHGYVLLHKIQMEVDKYAGCGNKTSAAAHVFNLVLSSSTFMSVVRKEMENHGVEMNADAFHDCLRNVKRFGFEEFRLHMTSNGSDMCNLNKKKVFGRLASTCLLRAMRLIGRREMSYHKHKQHLIDTWSKSNAKNKVCRRHLVAIMLSSLMRNLEKYAPLLEQFDINSRSFAKHHYIQSLAV